MLEMQEVPAASGAALVPEMSDGLPLFPAHRPHRASSTKEGIAQAEAHHRRRGTSRAAVGIGALLLLGSMLTGTPALAHDDGEPYADFYRSLKMPGSTGSIYGGSGLSCCAEHHDCEQVDDYRSGKEPGSVEVKFHGEWLLFKKEKVLDRVDNPTGRPVACVHNSYGVPTPMCFVRAAEG